MKTFTIDVDIQRRGAGRNLRFAGFLTVNGIVVDSHHLLGKSADDAKKAAREWVQRTTADDAKRLLTEWYEAEQEAIEEQRQELAEREARFVAAKASVLEASR